MIKHLARTKWGKSALAALTALTLNSTNAFADTPAIEYSNNAPMAEYSELLVHEPGQTADNPQHIEPLDVIVETALAYGIRQVWHELGHYVAAHAFGYGAVMHGPQIDGNQSYIAYTDVSYGDEVNNTTGDMVISSAGIGFTTIGNIMLTNYLVNADADNSIRPFLGTLSIMMMVDRYAYVTGAALLHFSGQEVFRDNDVSRVLNWAGIGKDAGYAMILTGTIAEAALRWREFAYLYQTAVGNNPEYKPSGFVFSFVPGEDSVRLSFGGQF